MEEPVAEDVAEARTLRTRARRNQDESLCDFIDGLSGDPSMESSVLDACDAVGDGEPHDGAAPKDAPAVDEGSESDGYEDLLEHAPLEFVEDMAKECLEALGAEIEPEDVDVDAASSGAPPMTEGVPSAPKDTDREDVGPSGGLVADVEEDSDQAAEESLSTRPSVEGPTKIDVRKDVIMDDNGFISCPRQPWAEFASIGRITTWPANKPMEKRSVSCKCHIHAAKCSSPARMRIAVTDEELLAWLFAGKCEPLASAGRCDELTKEHKALWAPTIDGLRKKSSGSARSSTDVV